MKKDLIITIFGSTGDLTARKLLPAITKLYTNSEITDNVLVVALGRKDFDTSSYLDAMQNLTTENLDLETLKKLVHYYKIQITDKNDYVTFNEYIRSQSHEKTKHIYYLAIGPEILGTVAKNISESNLISKNNQNEVLVFEKPFGHNLASAKEINQMLWQYFDESQLYRIDHYLGKEMIQNLLSVRFSNRIFEDTWSNKSIESIKIYAKEKEGILNRAGYYDTSGALKDMVQSHLLQVLSLVAMEAPLNYQSDEIKNEKVKVLKNLTFDKESIIFGQYDGYLNEANIPSDSKTETFVYFKAYVNTPRFKGVPFEILTGKALKDKASFIEITYLPSNHDDIWDKELVSNKLKISFAPSDSVDLSINSKTPGLKDNLEEVSLHYNMKASINGNVVEAYEKLILDIVDGHKTLFTRWDEIEASWSIVDEIKKHKDKLVIYKDDEILNKLK